MVRALLVLILPPLLTALWLAGWPVPPGAGRSVVDEVAVSQSLGGIPDEGFQRAYAPRPLRFPEDHGPHPGFRNEWWYFTGNLSAPGGRRFGYQLTLFRIALAPAATVADSAWRSHELYMGHLALSDVEGRRHHAYERFARAALGLAGAGVRPLRVWLEDWR
ncbi:MAG TPA: carotenoid 1,2-hydratase, partial [Candidatus Competibacteraceae bacterium]|nr:carotenoid 1,2-hydratase [Candidatus Competibacteraceae bacterium]